MRRPLTDNLRFALGLSGVAVGAALFAIAFRLSLAWLYRSAYHADNVVDGITNLPRWLRLLVPVAGPTVAGLIARFRNAPSQNVSNVMEARSARCGSARESGHGSSGPVAVPRRR